MSHAPADAVTAVSLQATATRGRFVVSAGPRHFVSDARAASGGPGEAVNAGELLLAALGSCALAVIQQEADARDWPLGPARVEVLFERDPEDSTRYARIELQAALTGQPRARAQALLDKFTATCPIFNTLSRGAPGRVRATLAA